MSKLSAVSTATILALTALLGSGSGARAGCDEDCQYEVQESAYERASEHDDEGDDEYERSERRHFYQPARGREQPTVRAEATRAAKPVAVASPDPEPQPQAARMISETENSSIATGDDEVAEPGTAEKKVATAKDVGCKKFFASAGMTLSVPCE